MVKIESLGNVLTNPRNEPKPIGAGIWKKNGKIEWAAKSRNTGMPEEMQGKIKNLLWRTPENIDSNVLGTNQFKGKDIVEVIFSGKDGKPDEVVILEQDVSKRFRGKVREKRAKPTYEQITDLIKQRGEQPKEIYWERDEVKNGTGGHIEATIPYGIIEIGIKHITNGVESAKKGRGE